jgi:hypothetical protein
MSKLMRSLAIGVDDLHKAQKKRSFGVAKEVAIHATTYGATAFAI